MSHFRNLIYGIYKIGVVQNAETCSNCSIIFAVNKTMHLNTNIHFDRAGVVEEPKLSISRGSQRVQL